MTAISRRKADRWYFFGCIVGFVAGSAVAVGVYVKLDTSREASIDVIDALPLWVAGAIAALVACFGLISGIVEREREMQSRPGATPPPAAAERQLVWWEQWSSSLASWAWAAAGGYTLVICGLATQQNGSTGWVPVALVALAAVLFVSTGEAREATGLRTAVLLVIASALAVGVLFATARWPG